MIVNSVFTLIWCWFCILMFYLYFTWSVFKDSAGLALDYKQNRWKHPILIFSLQNLIFFKVDYYRFKVLFNLDETWYGVTPVYVESKTKRIFAIACLGKKLVFHTEICDYFKYFFLKIGLFRRIKELSKWNQTRYGVSPVYVESKTKRIFAIACLGKKLVFHTEICDYFKYCILKIGLFRRIKELSKWNQTRYGVSPVYVESKTKRIFAIACLGKKLVFHTEICDYFV